MRDSAGLSMSAALRAMDAGDLTAEALLESCFERVDEREGEIHAWVTMDRDAARAKARATDAAGRPGLIGSMKE